MPSKWTRARMTRLVAQWRDSDESQASFARRHHIPAWTFWYWQRQLSGPGAPEPPPPTFVPVQVAVDEAPVIELVLKGGDRLQVRAGASADLVQSAVTALRSTC